MPVFFTAFQTLLTRFRYRVAFSFWWLFVEIVDPFLCSRTVVQGLASGVVLWCYFAHFCVLAQIWLTKFDLLKVFTALVAGQLSLQFGSTAVLRASMDTLLADAHRTKVNIWCIQQEDVFYQPSAELTTHINNVLANCSRWLLW